MKDNIPLGQESVVFHGLIKEYLYIIDQMKKRGATQRVAINVANNLTSAFLNFSNNNKFAEAPSILVAPEEEHPH